MKSQVIFQISYIFKRDFSEYLIKNKFIAFATIYDIAEKSVLQM